MKKVLSLILIGMIFGVTLVFAASKVFSDVPSNEWYSNAVKSLSEKGIVAGYPDGTFRPSKTVNRAELAVMLDATIDYILNASNENELGDHSSMTPVANGTKYENFIYRFSLVFPESWGNVQEAVTDGEVWTDIKLTAENDSNKYIEFHIVPDENKDNWVVTDFEHSLLESNSAYSFYYFTSADNAGKLGTEDPDSLEELSDIVKTFKLF